MLKGQNSAKLILWNEHHHYTKHRHRRSKMSVYILGVHRWPHCQQSTNKQIERHIKWKLPWPSGIYLRDSRVVQHMYIKNMMHHIRIKDKKCDHINWWRIEVDKIQHHFIIKKNHNKLRIEVKYLDTNTQNPVTKKNPVSIIMNREKLKAFFSKI
jgi:hypothetical protein